MELKGKTAIVTGAGRGIGEGIAKAVGREGANVVVNNRSMDAAEAVAGAIERDGGLAMAYQADVTNTDEITAMVDATVERFGAVDILVNNAGIQSTPRLLKDITEEQWDRVLKVNLKGVFLCCKRAIGEMLDQEPIGAVRGRVINISSQHGMVGAPGHVAYCTSKGGVINLTHQIAVDYARDGILVNAVAPGVTDTAASRTYVEEDPDRDRQAIAMGRRGRPEEQAGAILFLLSELSSYITGQTLLVDGGLDLRWGHLGADNTSLFIKDESFRAAIRRM